VDENNKKTEIKDYSWYFWVDQKSFNSLGTEFWVNLQNEIGEYNKPIVEDIEQTNDGYVKIYTHTNNFRSENYKDNRKILLDRLRALNIQTYEADYDSAKRYMIDNNIQFTTNYNIAFWDIETDDRRGNMTNPEILSYSIREFNRPIIKHKKFTDERQGIEEMVNDLKKYDIIATFNGKGFDRPVTINRMKFHKLIKKGTPNPWYNDIIHFDMHERMEKVFEHDEELIDYSLESFAQRFLGRGKVDWRKESKCSTIYEVAQKYPDLLKEYNNEDCNLLNDLEKKLGVLEQAIALCAFAGQPISRFWISDILDMYICRQAYKRGIKLPTANQGDRWKKLTKEEAKRRKKYTGGYVREPERGFYPRPGETGSVFVFDFKSLYPSIMRSLNMSMETWVKCKDWPKMDTIEGHLFLETHAISANGLAFRQDEDGIIKTLQGELLALRKEYKTKLKNLKRGTPEYKNADIQQIVVKEMANSMYGIIGMRGTRYNTYFKGPNEEDWGAEAITLTAQLCAKLLEYEVVPELKKQYPDQRFEVIYQDTDSMFIYSSMNLKLYSKEINKIFAKIIKDKLGIKENYIELDYERTFKTFLLNEKKKYMGYMIDVGDKAVDEIYIKGLDRKLKPTIQYT
jgi:DNA polymerase I